jgi:hypothetical protein
MLHEDFNTSCRLLNKMAAHPELQSSYVSPHPFKYVLFSTSFYIIHLLI